MEFISSHSNYAAQVKALIEQGHCLALGAFVCFFLSYEYLNLMSQEAADGSGTPSGADLGLLNCFSVKADRYILLPVSFATDHNFLRYTYYTCSTYFACSQGLVGLRRAVGHVLQTNSPQSSDHMLNPAGNLICTQHAAKSLRKVRKSSPWARHHLLVFVFNNFKRYPLARFALKSNASLAPGSYIT